VVHLDGGGVVGVLVVGDQIVLLGREEHVLDARRDETAGLLVVGPAPQNDAPCGNERRQVAPRRAPVAVVLAPLQPRLLLALAVVVDNGIVLGVPPVHGGFLSEPEHELVPLERVLQPLERVGFLLERRRLGLLELEGRNVLERPGPAVQRGPKRVVLVELVPLQHLDRVPGLFVRLVLDHAEPERLLLGGLVRHVHAVEGVRRHHGPDLGHELEHHLRELVQLRLWDLRQVGDDDAVVERLVEGRVLGLRIQRGVAEVPVQLLRLVRQRVINSGVRHD
jgi:hypothetical protein